MATHWTLGCRAGGGTPTSGRALVRERVAELAAAGATQVREEHYDGGLGHVVMLDPDGNEFCVA